MNTSSVRGKHICNTLLLLRIQLSCCEYSVRFVANARRCMPLLNTYTHTFFFTGHISFSFIIFHFVLFLFCLVSFFFFSCRWENGCFRVFGCLVCCCRLLLLGNFKKKLKSDLISNTLKTARHVYAL